MLVSKPKPSALFSISMFVLISLTGGIWALLKVNSGNYVWYHQLMALLLNPMGLAIGLKSLIGWRKISIGKDKVTVQSILDIRKKQYKLSDMAHWSEKSVKTFNGVYKDLTIQFDKKAKVAVNNQEHSEYAKVRQYLQKKYPRKKTET